MNYDRNLLKNPNKYAKLSTLFRINIFNIYKISGYQNYVILGKNKKVFLYGSDLSKKLLALKKALKIIDKEEKLEELSFLDVGTSNGFFLLAAKRLGFRKITGIDIDEKLIIFSKQASFFDEFNIFKKDFWRLELKFDFVSIFAGMHWHIGQLLLENKVSEPLDLYLSKVSSITNKYCLIEYIDFEDRLLRKYKHNSINYSKKDFETSCLKYFTHLKKINSVSETREIFLLVK